MRCVLFLRRSPNHISSVRKTLKYSCIFFVQHCEKAFKCNKLYTLWIPHTLSELQKLHRVQLAQSSNNLTMANPRVSWVIKPEFITITWKKKSGFIITTCQLIRKAKHKYSKTNSNQHKCENRSQRKKIWWVFFNK